MRTPRAWWRLLVLPLYVLIAGVASAFALARTSGSIIRGLAPLAPWALVLSGALALALVAGGLLRSRRRLASMRRGTRARLAEAAPAPAAAKPEKDARQVCLEHGRA